MDAILHTRFGSPEVLRLARIEMPAPRQGEVRVRVHAASVNFSDPTFVGGRPFMVRLMGAGLFRPSHPIPGADISGTVDAVGAGVTRLKTGDEVFGDISDSGWGGFAEYVCTREDLLARKPEGVPFDEAAAAPQAAVTALQGIRDAGHLEAGQRVLIIGAAGGIGTFAVQIAGALGAEVTAVCSTASVEMVRGNGARHVIDYTRDDFARGTARYDLILDIVANRKIREYLGVLTPQGTYVAAAFNPAAVLFGPILTRRGGKSVRSLAARTRREDLEYIGELIESGQVRPVIDRRYPLEETAEAVRYYAERHNRGKVVIVVHEGEQ